MKKSNLYKRIFLLLLGLFFTAMGVALTKKGNLGVSPISSAANVLCEAFPFFTLGNWLIVINCLLILGQVLVLRKQFQIHQLLQIPMSFVFGWFTDFWMWALAGLNPSLYLMQVSLVLLGTLVLGIGIVLALLSDTIMNSAEAFVRAVSQVSGKEFHILKIIFDVFCVSTAIVLSLIFFSGKLIGVREGTIIAALFTGVAVKIVMRPLKNLILPWLS